MLTIPDFIRLHPTSSDNGPYINFVAENEPRINSVTVS